MIKLDGYCEASSKLYLCRYESPADHDLMLLSTIPGKCDCGSCPDQKHCDEEFKPCDEEFNSVDYCGDEFEFCHCPGCTVSQEASASFYRNVGIEICSVCEGPR